LKQGMTLTRVELMLDGAFAHGQAYVALSRVTSLAGLWMRTNLRVEQVTAHPEVLRYYNALSESRRNPTNWQDTTASTAASASGTSHGTFPSGFMGGAAVHSFPAAAADRGSSTIDLSSPVVSPVNPPTTASHGVAVTGTHTGPSVAAARVHAAAGCAIHKASAESYCPDCQGIVGTAAAGFSADAGSMCPAEFGGSHGLAVG
jgi:hypothetical protein